MRLLITGGGGVLGSALACNLIEQGYKVDVMDVVRPEEAWRLAECIHELGYYWRSEIDITSFIVEKYDVVVDAAIASADRPFAVESPVHAALGNVLPSLQLLESVRKARRKPVVVYPSSFNSLYGNINTIYREDLLPDPASVYGWTKASVELLYRAYSRAYGLKTIIVRTSSTYGPKGRSDEFPHKVILHALNGKKEFVVRSPRARRLWTYIGDVVNFYNIFFDKIYNILDVDDTVTLHLAGNKGDVIHENIDLAKIILKIMRSDMKLVEGSYEPGELVRGKPISFRHDSTWTRRLLNWEPVYSVEEGLSNTIKWFSNNIYRYNIK